MMDNLLESDMVANVAVLGQSNLVRIFERYQRRDDDYHRARTPRQKVLNLSFQVLCYTRRTGWSVPLGF